MERDYYERLQINRDATDSDIKTTYRRLALKYHPNISTGNEDKFHEIAEAYEVLSDPRKKATYDKFGVEGLKAGIPEEFGLNGAWTSAYVYHGNPEKTFRQFFGIDSPFADFYSKDGKEVGIWTGGFVGRKQHDSSLERDLHLTLDDLFHGCVKKMKISRRVMNEDGYTSSIKDKILTVNVSPGWKQGTRITFPKDGDQGPNSVPADIVFIIRQKSHPRFVRQGNDLLYNVPISLKMALTGFCVDVETLDDKLLKISINEIVHPKYRKVVPGEGMPLSKDPYQRGDLIITFDTQFPTTLSAQTKRMIQNYM